MLTLLVIVFVNITIIGKFSSLGQILTGEDWNQVMYYAINSKGGRWADNDLLSSLKKLNKN